MTLTGDLRKLSVNKLIDYFRVYVPSDFEEGNQIKFLSVVLMDCYKRENRSNQRVIKCRENERKIIKCIKCKTIIQTVRGNVNIPYCDNCFFKKFNGDINNFNNYYGI